MKIAQILDRGEIAAWRDLYQMARAGGHLRARIHRIVLTVPVGLPHFWLVAPASLGEAVDVSARVPDYYEATALDRKSPRRAGVGVAQSPASAWPREFPSRLALADRESPRRNGAKRPADRSWPSSSCS